MSSREKLIKRFLSLPKDFTFNELDKLLSGFGYVKEKKGKTSGSRVVFKNEESRPIMLHKPHPEMIVKLYALKQVLSELKDVGLIEDKED